MTHKHTPGPWKTEANLLSPIVNAQGIAVLSSSINNEEVIANKKLIAAAPDLLTALIEIVKISDRKHDVWDNAKHVIYKATGEIL